MIYYAFWSLHIYRQKQVNPGFIIPTGNLGNAIAAYWAKAMGFPIREIVLATNANTVIPDYLKTGSYKPKPSIKTLANAMDVGDPNNFQRLQDLYPNFDIFKHNVTAISASDQDIKKTITSVYENEGIIICPHTATAYYARQQLSDEPWIVVATAHPSKFNNIIEPLLNIELSVPPQLEKLLSHNSNSRLLKPTLTDLQTWWALSQTCCEKDNI